MNTTISTIEDHTTNRGPAAKALLALLIALVAFSALAPRADAATATRSAKPACATVCLNPAQTAALAALNADRVANGLKRLTPQAQIQGKAQAWAQRLAQAGALSHSVLTDNVPACWRALGENVGYGPTVATIENAYMHSPHHRANILNASFTQAGVGVATSPQGQTYTVQVFLGGC